MANELTTDKKTLCVSALCEGSSIRAIERMIGVHRDTIMRLGVRIGEGCESIMDEKMYDLNSERIEIDEIWGFVGKKQKNVKEGDSEKGDTWTYIALDPDSKLVHSHR